MTWCPRKPLTNMGIRWSSLLPIKQSIKSLKFILVLIKHYEVHVHVYKCKCVLDPFLTFALQTMSSSSQINKVKQEVMQIVHFLIHESKLSRVAMSSGGEFHSFIVGGKKEYLMW